MSKQDKDTGTSSSSSSSNSESLRATWQELYRQTLPALARRKAASQRRWPVVLDHCFGRIILDAVVGDGAEPWDRRLARPAVRHMSDAQLDACIDLGRRIADGRADLVELDEQSLAARGKRSKHFVASSSSSSSSSSDKRGTDASSVKRKRGGGDDDEDLKAKRDPAQKGEPARKHQRGSEDDDMAASAASGGSDSGSSSNSVDDGDDAEEPGDAPTDATASSVVSEPRRESKKEEKKDIPYEELAELIDSTDMAPYRKSVLLAMCQIPRGRFSTYGAISDFLKSSPRAVGNNLKNNPFAPDVPCHRILASDGKIGGYCGQWAEGNLIDKKRKILREEGVKFDGKGKVIGQPWRGFK